MKEENLIKETKELNGNKSFSQKDLLFYIVGRVDKLDDKIDNINRMLSERLDKKLDKKAFTTLALASVTVLIAILGGMFKFFTTLLKGGT